MKFVFFNSYHGANNALCVCERVNGKYHTCPKHWRAWQREIYNDIDNSDIVIIWNSLEPCTYWIKDICHQLGKPYLFIEYGFIPQKDMFHLDTKGIIKQSSLNDSLVWLTNDMINESENYINKLMQHKKWYNKAENYILCPLQLPWDTSIYLCSKYKNMNEFILDVIKLYPDEQIIITPHPKLRDINQISPQIFENYPNIIMNMTESTLTLAQHAKEVVGITSTVLYETLAFHKKTTALGNCPIKTHNGDRKLALCAIQRQFRFNNIDRFLSIVYNLLDK